jgi:DNA end-binding protein Ku
MSHAIWNGSITFGLVTIPVKLYSVIREHELRFNYLHEKDLGRIRYERVCSVCGEKVDWGDIVRGFPYSKDEYVVVRDEDFEKASPEATQSVDILEFVDLREIDPILFEVPYYLEPEKKGRHAYALLREALARSGKVGVARLVLRTREHLAALKANGKALIVELMHWADEVVPPTALDLPDDVKLSPAEMKMANLLIDTMSASFDAEQFRDRYTGDLMSLIEARAEGRRERGAKARPHAPTNVVDLARVLEESLARAKKKGRPGRGAAAQRPRRRGKHAA